MKAIVLTHFPHKGFGRKDQPDLQNQEKGNKSESINMLHYFLRYHLRQEKSPTLEKSSEKMSRTPRTLQC